MFSLLFTKSITDLVEWLRRRAGVNIISNNSLLEYIQPNLYSSSSGSVPDLHAHLKCSNSPPPHMHISLQGKQQVSEQSLMHGRPLEFWDAEHGGAGTGAELSPLLLRHGHASETQVDSQVPFQLGCSTTVKGLQTRGVGQRHEISYKSNVKPGIHPAMAFNLRLFILHSVSYGSQTQLVCGWSLRQFVLGCSFTLIYTHTQLITLVLQSPPG